MSKAPIMPFYVDAFMADTMELSEAEEGVYLRLLMCMWRNEGVLPNDDVRLARMVRVSKARWVNKYRPVLSKFFDVSGDVLTQKRLKKEWESIQEKSGKNSANGKRGAMVKALKNKESPLANAYKTLKRARGEAVSEQPSETQASHIHIHKDEDKYKYLSSSTCEEIHLATSEFEYLLVKSGHTPSDLHKQIQALVNRYGGGVFMDAIERARVNCAGVPLAYVLATLQNSETRLPKGSVQPKADARPLWEQYGMTKEQWEAA